MRVRRLATRIFACIGLLYVTVSATPLVNWWAAGLAGRWEDPTGDTLIVLGGSVFEDGIIGESSYFRSMYAIRAYRAGQFRRIVVSGGGAGQTVSNAMREFIVGSGVPAEVVTTESASLSTRENALDTARLLSGDGSRKVLMTSDYHMLRASRAFSKAGLVVEPRPIPDALKRAARWSGRWAVFLDLSTESLKLGYYYARRWI